MTREAKRELLFKRFRILVEELFPAVDNDFDYLLAVVDEVDGVENYVCSGCPRCFQDNIARSLDANNIGHNNETDIKEKVH